MLYLAIEIYSSGNLEHSAVVTPEELQTYFDHQMKSVMHVVSVTDVIGEGMAAEMSREDRGIPAEEKF